MDPRSLVDPSLVETALAVAALRSPDEPHLKLHRAWPTWEGGWCALFRLEKGDLSSAWGLVSAHPALPDRVRKILTSGSAVLLPTLRCYAVSLPTDPRLPHLGTLASSDAMRHELGAHLPRQARFRVRYRSYKPLYRVVIEYRFGSRPGESLFLKAQTRWGYESTRRVHEMLSATSGRVPQIARPVAFLAERHAILWPETPGESLRELMRRGEADALEGAAQALAALHRTRLDIDRQHDRRQELATVTRWAALAAQAFPEWRNQLQALLQGLTGALTGLPPERPCTAHRDFHDDQVLIDHGRPVLLDLDTVACAEPELDVGNFLAHLTLPPSTQSSGDLAKRFVAGYLRRGLPLDGGLLEWYRASALLRLGCVYAFRPGSEECVPELLRQTVRTIDRLRPKREVML